MKKIFSFCFLMLTGLSAACQLASNPVIYADVPDLSMIRVGNTYYMSSTTMHMSPGIPIMKSADLINWKLVGYVYNTLDSTDALNLNNGRSTYGQGSWASSLRYENGTFYVTTFSNTTGKTYIYSSKNIEKGPWKGVSFKPFMHDHTLFFDNGKAYMLYGSGKIMLAELNDDLSGLRPGTSPKMIIENASLPGGENIGLPSEGSQLFKVNGKYYLFNICWPKKGMRTVVIHRADKITGPYTGKMALQDKGVAQGGLISTPQGNWYAYLFKDQGAVGRVPYWVPVKWEDGWPVLGENGKVPDSLNLPASKGLIPGIVASDEFSKKELSLVWQWNHNPDTSNWSLAQRPGFLRISTSRVDTSILLARNTLTQRTIGPECSGIVSVDISHLKDGDRAGLLLLQKNFGWVGVKAEAGKKFIVMVSAESGESAAIPLTQQTIYLKAACDFKEMTDKAVFYYSLDTQNWKVIGQPLQMAYTLPHFMGYRFGLFNYAEKEAGGYADFDYFHVSDQL